jgi:hypothetical protein
MGTADGRVLVGVFCGVAAGGWLFWGFFCEGGGLVVDGKVWGVFCVIIGCYAFV